jgi:hypothetical protein
MTRRPLEAGDRVRVYDNDGGHRGTVQYWNGESVWVKFDSDDRPIGDQMVVTGGLRHPKQCRRLVKRERRRVWVALNKRNEIMSYMRIRPAADWQPQYVCVEFVEVPRRRK